MWIRNVGHNIIIRYVLFILNIGICHTHLLYLLYVLGLEQCKAREDDAGKEEDNEEDFGAKDLLIKRKVPAMMVGQAISVVGGYAEKVPTTEAPTAVKRLPEPILPTAQTKWVLAEVL